MAVGGFREYGLKVRPGNVPKVFTSDPVNGESRSTRTRGRTEGRRKVAFLRSSEGRLKLLIWQAWALPDRPRDACKVPSAAAVHVCTALSGSILSRIRQDRWT